MPGINQPRSVSCAEYLWLDGARPTQTLRSKTRVLPYNENLTLNDCPTWNFDGSSTGQADGSDSDCELKPVFCCPDPIRGDSHWVVLCEVFNADGTIHSTNSRAHLRKLMENGGKAVDAYMGFEQEYTLISGHSPLGWPKEGYPEPQGPFYCGVGASNVFGREIVEAHMNICAQAGLSIYGVNAEVMPGQWEFQVGYRGNANEPADPLTVSDQVWIARYFIYRITEQYGVKVSLDNKPVKGDWNGAGMHTNFSTADMRDEQKGQKAIDTAIKNLETKHEHHIKYYGHGLEERLTGLHETCPINEFRAGTADRGASVRIPPATAKKGCGYIEDRRPGANADPYKVSELLMGTICGL